MNKILPLIALIPLSAFSITDSPTKLSDGSYENINNRKEYTYDVYPGESYWNEDGRSYWRNLSPTGKGDLSMDTQKQLDEMKLIADHDGSTILFDRDSSKLDPSAKEHLSEVVSELIKDESSLKKVTLEGFASKPGTKDYNRELSKERALRVERYLISKGVNPSLIEVVARGEEMTLETAESSRRVVIQIEELNKVSLN